MLGWDSYFDEKFAQTGLPTATPARVIADFGADYLMHDGSSTKPAGRGRGDPAAGDWVALAGGVIGAILERRAVFSRRASGTETKQQVLAANVDITFVVVAATDVNVRRVERYLAIGWQSGAVPAVIMTKADLSDSRGSVRYVLESVAACAQVIDTSKDTGEGLD